MRYISLGIMAALMALASEAAINYPLGTYVYAGTAMNWRNEPLKAENGVKIMAVSESGTVLAVSKVIDADADSVNFRLEVPVSSVATAKSAAIGDAPRCMLSAPDGVRGAATETFPPILCASAVTNCVIVWSEAQSYTDGEGNTVQIPCDYLDGISYLMQYYGKDTYEPFADWDGDGYNNYEEYTAGTNPFDPSHYLKITAFTANRDNALLSFEFVGGHVYGLKSAKTLSNPDWLDEKFKVEDDEQEHKVLYASDNEDVGETTLYVTPVVGEKQMFYKLEVK